LFEVDKLVLRRTSRSHLPDISSHPGANRRIIEHDLPEEAYFLERNYRFCLNGESLVDMPSKTLDLLFRFLHQNEGKLSQRARKLEFALLSDDEVVAVECFYEGLFN